MAFTPYNTPLTETEMQTNALEIAQILYSRGWTLNAIAGALGNFESECTLNPNDPERATGYPTSTESRSHGFGLPQWTPWFNRFGVWAANRGYEASASDDNPVGQLLIQLDYLEYECTFGWNDGATWYANGGYSYTWTEYKTSTDSPSELARAFYWQYERSAASDPSTRPAQAEKWFTFLTGKPLKRLPLWLLFKIREHQKGGFKK